MNQKEFLELAKSKGLLHDPEDEDMLLQHFWTVNEFSAGDYRAYTTVDTKILYIHRFILFVTETTMMVDHKNGNPLDNRRSNLRIATNQQNCMNQKVRKGSKYKGVSKLPSGRYRARVTVDGYHQNIGVFNTPELAALAYNEAAIKQYGQFARLNVIGE